MLYYRVLGWIRSLFALVGDEEVSVCFIEMAPGDDPSGWCLFGHIALHDRRVRVQSLDCVACVPGRLIVLRKGLATRCDFGQFFYGRRLLLLTKNIA